MIMRGALVVLGVVVFVMRAQQPSPRDVVEALAEKQRATVQEAKRESLAKQTAAIRKQIQAPEGDSFFIVPMSPMAAAGESQSQMAAEADCDPLSRESTAPLVAKNAQATGLTPSLISAVIAQESAYRPCAISRAGAQGLMQLMPATARYLGVDDPLDPEQNVEAGSRFLRELLDRYGGNLMMALAAYNAGPARVDAYQGMPPFSETGRYVDQVLKRVLGDRPAKSPSLE
jgi:soluble lytic murein transglycosylase-like protein